MRARRGILMLSFVACLALSAFLVAHALPSEKDASLASSGDDSGTLPSAPDLNSNAGFASQPEAQSDGAFGFLAWIGAAAASAGVVTTFVLLRVEVRSEKAAIKARKNREEYRRDLRQYNAQLRGPPRDNT